MLSIFEFTQYREYLNAWIAGQGERSYGLKGKIAQALNVSSSLVSQVLSGAKTLTPDQASDLGDYLGLNEIESDYLHLLIDHDRAGSRKYREKLERKIASLRNQSQSLGKRVPRAKELSDEQKAIYYSSWLFTGVRNLTGISEMNNVDVIARHLAVEPAVIARVMRFLLENGLCKDEAGKITYGPASTHVDKDSPFVNKHHQNWRLQAIQKMENKKDDDAFFTSPMSLSKKAADEIRSLIPTFIQNVMKISGPSDSEITTCLNLDWFKY